MVAVAAVAGSATAANARHRHWRSHAAAAEAGEARKHTLLPARASGPVTIVVSTDQQKLTVYDDGAEVATTTVSTGVPEHPTPHGVFSVIQKQRFHASNIYSSAPMPFMQRITWSGVALHEGHVTGHPASHGCIRMPHAFAVELFRYTREGARVIVSREDVSPAPFYGQVPLEASRTPADAASPAIDAGAGQFAGEIEPRQHTSATAAVSARRNVAAAYPVNILVNRKSGKLFVRRAFEPVFEVPIAIDEPARPLGTHVFIARGGAAAAGIDWTEMTLPAPAREARLDERAGPKSRRAIDAAASAPVTPSDASDGLARLHLAPGTSAEIASLLSPGATIILSDDGARGRETWNGTNFIALSE